MAAADSPSSQRCMPATSTDRTALILFDRFFSRAARPPSSLRRLSRDERSTVAALQAPVSPQQQQTGFFRRRPTPAATASWPTRDAGRDYDDDDDGGSGCSTPVRPNRTPACPRNYLRSCSACGALCSMLIGLDADRSVGRDDRIAAVSRVPLTILHSSSSSSSLTQIGVQQRIGQVESRNRSIDLVNVRQLQLPAGRTIRGGADFAGPQNDGLIAK